MKIPSGLLRPCPPCATLKAPNPARRHWRGLFSEGCPCKLSICPGAPSPSGWPPPCSAPDAPLPSASQGSSAPQVSTVSASLSQVSSLRGALDRLEPEADCLVLASGGEYYRFERNGVDVSGLIPGDPVTVTYTGALDPEEGTVSAVLLSITRDTL